MAKRYVSPETKRRALELMAAGMSQKDAAEQVGVGYTSISPWKRDAVLRGEWDEMVKKAAAAPAPPAQAEPPAPPAEPKAETKTRYRQPDNPNGSPFLGFGSHIDSVPERPTPSTPMSVMTTVEPCIVCGRLTPPAEMGAGRKAGICPACLGLLRGVLDKKRKKLERKE